MSRNAVITIAYRLLRQRRAGLWTNGGYVARVFKFIDISGCEIHTIQDPDDKLPVPTSRQVISIGFSRMHVESVTTLGNSETCRVHFVRVRTSAETN